MTPQIVSLILPDKNADQTRIQNGFEYGSMICVKYRKGASIDLSSQFR